MARTSRTTRGISVADARELLLQLDGVTTGRSYGHPSFLVKDKFFARFRDDDTVLALRLGSIDDRDVLLQMDPRAFFFTEHYRNYPAVLIRLADVPPDVFGDVVTQAWRVMIAARSGAARKKARKARPKRRPGI